MTTPLTTFGPTVTSAISRGPNHTVGGNKTDAPGSSEKEAQGLDKACAEFESLFIYHLLKEMRASIPGDGYLGKSMQSETYTAMYDLEIARELSSQRGIGLADFLRRQLADRLGDVQTQDVKKELDLY